MSEVILCKVEWREGETQEGSRSRRAWGQTLGLADRAPSERRGTFQYLVQCIIRVRACRTNYRRAGRALKELLGGEIGRSLEQSVSVGTEGKSA